MRESIKRKIEQLKEYSVKLDNVPAKVAEVAREYDDVLLNLNRDQMLQGRDAEGQVLAPSYLDDPYFKSRQAAERYARMKYVLESRHKARIWNPQLFPDKDSNTPNLIIRGDFQDAMFIRTSPDGFTIGSSYVDAPDIENKYPGLFGLAPESRVYFWNEFLRKELIKYLKA